ncbi:hypothetical protein GCM10009107_60990 [Ideonella azotifigens]|uniref:Uncharacterized protein n=1 Tax=Ideonella azotifigens TaxID=513160 RepID=A0ABN1KL10_9BURK
MPLGQLSVERLGKTKRPGHLAGVRASVWVQSDEGARLCAVLSRMRRIPQPRLLLVRTRWPIQVTACIAPDASFHRDATRTAAHAQAHGKAVGAVAVERKGGGHDEVSGAALNWVEL